MKIVMMGSGGVGGYFGGRLAAGGADVHFVARGAHLEAMRSQGLTIEGGPEPFHLPQVPATNDPSSIDVADFVLIAVKLWDTAAAIEQVKPIVGPHTTVISFQNGVLKDRYLIDAFGVSRVMGGVGYVATAIDRPGVIRQTGRMQRLLFGELDGTTSERGPPSRSLPERWYRCATERGHTARDLAKIRVPGGPIGYNDHDPQAHRTDTGECANARLLARRYAGSRCRGTRPGESLCLPIMPSIASRSRTMWLTI